MYQAQGRILSQAEENALCFGYAYMRTERRTLLDFRQAPYTRQILLDDRPHHVCIACAQSRKTVTYLTKVFWKSVYPQSVGRKACSAIYTFPTQGDVNEFSGVRAKTMIESSPLLYPMLTRINSASVKRFVNGSVIYFRGTFTERAAISVPADIVIHDEYDRSKMDVMQMYSDRLRAAVLPHTYRFSTPTIPGFGVADAWQDTDQNEWVWRCGKCGHDQIFAPMDGQTSWSDGLDVESAEAHFLCTRCHAYVERSWVEAGHWEPMNPGAARAGYHISGIMPPEVTAQRLKEEYDLAKFIELFIQGHIGLPAVSGEKQITEDMIRFGEWTNTLSHPGPTFAGIDQGKKLDFVATLGNGKVVSVQRFDDWDSVASAMKTLNVRLLVGDSQPDSRPLQKMVQDFPGRVYLADYSLGRMVDDKVYALNAHDPFVRIHRTGGLDLTRDRIMMGGQEGGDMWPACQPELRRDLISHLIAPMRTLEFDAHGQPVAIWKTDKPDHLRHAHLYATMAVEVYRECGPAWWEMENASGLPTTSEN